MSNRQPAKNRYSGSAEVIIEHVNRGPLPRLRLSRADELADRHTPEAIETSRSAKLSQHSIDLSRSPCPRPLQRQGRCDNFTRKDDCGEYLIAGWYEGCLFCSPRRELRVDLPGRPKRTVAEVAGGRARGVQSSPMTIHVGSQGGRLTGMQLVYQRRKPGTNEAQLVQSCMSCAGFGSFRVSSKI